MAALLCPLRFLFRQNNMLHLNAGVGVIGITFRPSSPDNLLHVPQFPRLNNSGGPAELNSKRVSHYSAPFVSRKCSHLASATSRRFSSVSAASQRRSKSFGQSHK